MVLTEKLTPASTSQKKMAANTTMMATITEVIQVSRRVVQVILRASERTSRANWAIEVRFLGASDAKALGAAIAAAVLAARLRIWEPCFLAISAVFNSSVRGATRPPQFNNADSYRVAGVEGLEPPALGFGDRCSTS